MDEIPGTARAFAALELRYDGPLPEPIRRIAEHGSAAHWRLVEATGQGGLFAALIRDQMEAIRRCRGAGSIPPHLMADLALYRRRWQWWSRR